MRNAVVEEFAAGVMLITIGMLLDHTVGVIAAIAGFVALSIGLGSVANTVAQHWPANHGHRLSLRRWSGV